MLEVRRDEQEEIVRFLSRTLWGTLPKQHIFGIGSYWNGKLIGGFLYTDHRHLASGKYSMELHMAGSPGWLSRKALRMYFSYPFLEKGCSRVMGPVLRGNKHSANVTQRFGFTLDGIIRSGIAPEHDLMIWTMTRAECPWLR